MGLTIFTTADPVGFITSDAPAVMFNPIAYRFPPQYRAPGLDQREIEITLPLSPRHFAMYSHMLNAFSYKPLEKAMVDELNRRTAAFAGAALVSRSAEVNPEWFTKRDRPQDAWENLNLEEQDPPQIDSESSIGEQLDVSFEAHQRWWRRVYRHDPWQDK